jgi:FkbM family methyltransferase
MFLFNLRVKEPVHPNPVTRKYFSQCGEDAFLNDRYFKNKRNGSYIELGAIDGVMFSNTKFFEDQLGWRGVLIEPHPIQFKSLVKNRPNNLLFNNLVSCLDEPQKFRYFESTLVSAISGVENTLAKSHIGAWFDNPDLNKYAQDRIQIIPKTFTELLRSTPYTHFDLLSLDVEGHELEVLQSWDFSIPIDVILIEMLGQDTEREEACRKILTDNGYKFDCTFKHNEVFVMASSLQIV